MSLLSPSATVGAAVTLDGTLAALLMQDGSVWHLWRPRSERAGDSDGTGVVAVGEPGSSLVGEL